MPQRSSTAACVRNVANWSVFKPAHKFDKTSWSPEVFQSDMQVASPKLHALIEQIRKLDEQDQKQHGKRFKHMIYSDVKTANAGPKIIAAGLLSAGFKMLYDSSLKLDEQAYGPDAFALLSSTKIYGKDMGVQFRKKLLQIFNERPANVYGDRLRIILLDSGFKEGIDLFDVKYVHIFEPALTPSDEKQVIGRGTRFCGQKGLEFHNDMGWPLHVYRYEVVIPEVQRPKYTARTLFEVFLHTSGMDLRNIVLSNALERLCIDGAVDHDLNLAIHDADLLGAQLSDSPGTPAMPAAPVAPDAAQQQAGGGKARRRRHVPKPPTKIMTHAKLREYIKERYEHHSWPQAKLENKCMDAKVDKRFVNLNPTQNFVRLYFRPSSAYKGLLLWHTTGSGKTCTAIATATSSFEREGYSILWVTRHTLKADIWKNMFKQICSQVLKAQIKKGEEQLPGDNIVAPLRILSDRWLAPISYKQFSNLLLRKNKIYDEMVRRNGEEDPLRRTLIIIDEAHKLYASDLKEVERPNVQILRELIHKSYVTSQKDSCKVLLMTATPFTDHPMNLIKLLNLMRTPDTILPETLEDFASQFLDGEGRFTPLGEQQFLDKIAGYISYLNREKDARSFAYPVFHSVKVPMSLNTVKSLNTSTREIDERIAALKRDAAVTKEQEKVLKAKLTAERKGKLAFCKQLPNPPDRPRCKGDVEHEMAYKKNLYTNELQTRMAGIMQNLDAQKAARKQAKQDQQQASKENLSQETALDNCLKR